MSYINCVFGLIIFQLQPAVLIYCCTSDDPNDSPCFGHHRVHKVMFICLCLINRSPLLCGLDLNRAVLCSVRANPTVCAVIVVFLALYAVLLVVCNQADVHVEKNLGTFLLPDNNPSDQFLYTVTIDTGFRSRARMTAKVLINMTRNWTSVCSTWRQNTVKSKGLQPKFKSYYYFQLLTSFPPVLTTNLYFSLYIYK